MCERSTPLLQSLVFVAYKPAARAEQAMILLLSLGSVVVIIVLVVFLADKRYRRPTEPERDVDFVEVRTVARTQLYSLASTAVLLAEKEGIVSIFSRVGLQAARRVGWWR